MMKMPGRGSGPSDRLSSTHNAASKGVIEAHSWVESLGLHPPPGALRWHAEISLDVVDGPARVEFDDRVDTRFHIDVYSEEWGFFFCHAGRVSWIRVTDIAFVHGRDDHQLLTESPSLEAMGDLMRRLEAKHAVRVNRPHAIIGTNITAAEPQLRRWLLSL
jgi:hypothetical protein